MGWPSGHALSSCSETEFHHWKLDMPSALYSMPTVAGAWMWMPPVEVAKIEQMEMRL
ncbi:MAG: hypothetical protein COB08_016775 [Rhodobacteraceae bacterium]|nr:hypothetical protein [Paracoccaceae bacterium]